MKKHVALSACMLLIGALSLQAQDIKTVKKYFEAKDWANAKTAIDQAVTAKPNAESWFWKSKVYYTISTDETAKSLATEPRMEAFKAFQEAYKLDKKNIEDAIAMGPTAAQLGNKYAGANDIIFNIYASYYDEGAKGFNNKKFAESFAAFVKTDEISRYIAANKLLEIPALDTNVVFYAAAAGDAADKKTDALPYFLRLAEAKVKGEDRAFIYRWIPFYYKDKKDMTNLKKYSDLGREVYPEDDFFDKLEIDIARESKDFATLEKKYEDMIAKKPKDFNLIYDFGTELFEAAFTSDSVRKAKDPSELYGKIEEVFKRALQLDPASSLANLALGKSFYNQGIAFEEQIRAVKGKTPADLKKKADLEAQRNALFDKAIPYCDAAAKTLETKGKLTSGDKADLKSAYTLLSEMYKGKKMLDKVKEYDAKYDGVEKNY